MESKHTAAATEVLNLRDTLTQVAEGELSEQTFSLLSKAAYSDDNGREQLDRILADWDAVSSSFASTKGTSEIVAGYLNYIKGNLPEAEERLKGQKSLEWGSYYYARVLADLRRFDEAIKVIEKVRSASPDFLPAVYLSAKVRCQAGTLEGVEEILAGVEAADGESPEWAFHKGYSQECLGEYRDAINYYRQAVERNPQFSDAWFRLGFMLDLYGIEKENEAEEVISAYEQCLKSVPVHTHAIVNLGLAYEDRERFHDAAKCYETVLRVYPNHARAKLYLGDAIAATKMFYDREQEKNADRHSQVLKIPVTDFELSVRSRNCLQKMNIESLGDLIMKTEQELLSYKNFGETSLTEIKEMLCQKGLRLGQGLEEKGREPPAGRNPLEATTSSDILEKPIEELNLSVRSRRCMERLDIHTIRDLINKTEVELMSAKNFGMTSLNEIKKKLAEYGLSLRS